MEGPLKELGKLEKVTTARAAQSASVADSLDVLIASMYETKKQMEESGFEVDTVRQLARTVDVQRKEVDERQKEVYSSISRLGKALEKVRPNHAPGAYLDSAW